MIIARILYIPRVIKRLVLLASDIVILVTALWVSFSLRFEEWYWPNDGINDPIFWLIIGSPLVAVPVFTQFGLYRAIIRYLGMRATWSVAKAVALYAVLWGLLALLSNIPDVPRSVIIINGLVTLFGIGGSRMLARKLLRKLEHAVKKSHATDGDLQLTRVVIFGAGEAGRQLALALSHSGNCKLMGFVDDDPKLQGRDLLSQPILRPEKLESFVTKHNIDDVLLAIPSASRKDRNKIIERLRSINAGVRTLPGLQDMAKGRVDYSSLLDLDIDDLLAREPAQCDEVLMASAISDEVIMITGAGGSIGSELCRQVIRRKPKILLLFELNEFSLFSIHNELLKVVSNGSAEAADHIKIIPILGSVTDEVRLNDVLSIWQPSMIYHAAALKHVPLVEHNVSEGVQTNIFGTLAVAKSAIMHQIDKVVLISTDKAVKPTNVMGASKRSCELLLQALAKEKNPTFCIKTDEVQPCRIPQRTQFAIVRFGNVLGSSGSVVPYFREQIKQGGPVTLTHLEITRFFMTIPEAAELVMQAGAMATAQAREATNEAEVYVLDMGEPVKILDLATRMIELCGHQVKDGAHQNGDIAIKVIGLRPGEKLYEELLIGNNPKATQHPRIMKAQEDYIDWEQLQPLLKKMYSATTQNDVVLIRSILQELVPEYKPNKEIVDWVHLEKIS